MLYHPSTILPGLLKNNGINYSNFISPAAVPIWVKLLMNKLGRMLVSQEGLEIYV